MKAQYEQCIKDWDEKTHMTRREWERTCRRVTDDRIKYLRQHGYTPEGEKSPESKKKK